MKTEFDEIVEFYHEIGRMLHFAVFEKDLKENHDCRQFSRLKYACIQKDAAILQLYSSRLKCFLDQKIKAFTYVTRV